MGVDNRQGNSGLKYQRDEQQNEQQGKQWGEK
jgi:hypothetical protein